MLKVKVNDNKEIEIDLAKKEMMIGGKPVQINVSQISKDKYHLLWNDGSYTIELLGKDDTGKQLTLAVNGKKQQAVIQDEFDELLHKLGMDKLNTNKMNQVKAPMPGLVLKINVAEGDVVKKGDSLLVLEAMKMENSIKATGEGVVKKIIAQPRQAVDKNQVLIVME
jgi:biotin carboxyl carrier protein